MRINTRIFSQSLQHIANYGVRRIWCHIRAISSITGHLNRVSAHIVNKWNNNSERFWTHCMSDSSELNLLRNNNIENSLNNKSKNRLTNISILFLNIKQADIPAGPIGGAAGGIVKHHCNDHFKFRSGN